MVGHSEDEEFEDEDEDEDEEFEDEDEDEEREERIQNEIIVDSYGPEASVGLACLPFWEVTISILGPLYPAPGNLTVRTGRRSRGHGHGFRRGMHARDVCADPLETPPTRRSLDATRGYSG